MPCTSCESCPITDVYLGNDHVIMVEGLAIDDVPTDDASITYQIYDSDDTLIVGASGTIVSLGTSGNYRAIVDKTIIALLSVGNEYMIRITGTHPGTGTSTDDFEFNQLIRVKRRGRS